MSIIEKVAKTRHVLKEILDDQDFDVSSIELLSNEEINKLYDLQSTEALIDSLGYGSAGCNFSVKHEKVPSFILNIIYLNLPDRDSVSSRLSKSFKDKIYKLYEKKIILGLAQLQSAYGVTNIKKKKLSTKDSINILKKIAPKKLVVNIFK